MNDGIVIYGATGYMGKLVAATAKAHKLSPLLAARNGGKLLNVASALGFEAQTAALTTSDRLDRVLAGARVLVNAAGPFAETAEPLIDACIRNRVPYIDVSGEMESIEACAERDADARAAGIPLLPGSGFDVVASDCLAAHVAARAQGPSRISIALSGLSQPSRGTARLFLSRLSRGVPVYRDGGLVELPEPLTCAIDFGAGPREAVTIGASDLMAVHTSTGIPNVELYFEMFPGLKRLLTLKTRYNWILELAPVQRMIARKIERMPEGPTPKQRDATQAVLLVDAMRPDGTHVISRLTTPNPYTLTALTSIAVVREVLAGHVAPGFSTPANAFGAEFILKFPGVKLQDVA